MIKRLCIFTINFAYNRQWLINYFEKTMPKEVELFLFVPKECKGKFSSKRIKIYESKKNKYSCFIDFRKFCKKNKIDAIFSLGALPQEGFLMAFASLFSNTKSICHMVVNPYMAYKTGFNKPAIKAFFEFLLLHPMMLLVDRYYVAVEDIYQKSKKTFFYAKNKIDLLKYPTDTSFFNHKNKVECRKKLNLEKTKKIILYVGRIEYEKGSDIILELAKRNKDIDFILIGQLFDKKLNSLKTTNLTILTPQTRDSLVNYYNAADLCIFPSRAEAGPSVAKESMSCETPVIVPDMLGPRMLCPPAIKCKLSVEDFDKKIKYFFNLPLNEKKALSKKSRSFIEKEYSKELCKDYYINKLVKSDEKN
jgi:glycosyltransferase involved in cell wall biosynthesis